MRYNLQAPRVSSGRQATLKMYCLDSWYLRSSGSVCGGYRNVLRCIKPVDEESVLGLNSVRLTDDLQEKLEEIAVRLQRSKEWVICEALAQYVQKEEQAAARLERTQKAIVEAESRQVIDGEEVLDWIASWGAENEKQTPTSYSPR